MIRKGQISLWLFLAYLNNSELVNYLKSPIMETDE